MNDVPGQGAEKNYQNHDIIFLIELACCSSKSYACMEYIFLSIMIV